MNKSLYFYKHYVALVFLLLLPSCGKLVDWVQDTFKQVPSLDTQCGVSQEYLKSITLYDQLTTRAKFDVLWLSDQVRSLYVDLFTLKFGKTIEQKKALLRRQLEENNHFITFYVLSLYEVPLGEALSEWALFLSINDKHYAPLEIKTVELSPEYVCLFGKKFNRFKVAYSVKFDAKDIEDMPLLSENIDEMRLYFRSINNEVVFVWNTAPVPAQNDVIDEEEE